jgi:hypothetical protein
MELNGFPFTVVDWHQVEAQVTPGEVGHAEQKVMNFGAVRVRQVTYSPGYVSDHWCQKGHVLLCISGELNTRLLDGREFTLRSGMSYQVSDRAEAHRSSTSTGATLCIVD